MRESQNSSISKGPDIQEELERTVLHISLAARARTCATSRSSRTHDEYNCLASGVGLPNQLRRELEPTGFSVDSVPESINTMTMVYREILRVEYRFMRTMVTPNLSTLPNEK